MFRVQLAYNTLEKEIAGLEKQSIRRQDALTVSKQELDDDQKRVMSFV